MIRDNLSYERYLKYLKKNLKDIISEYKKLRKGEYDEVARVVRVQLKRLFENVKYYFEDLDQGVHTGYYEVIFDGDSYLRVDVNFFQNNFEWNGSKWVTKN